MVHLQQNVLVGNVQFWVKYVKMEGKTYVCSVVKFPPKSSKSSLTSKPQPIISKSGTKPPSEKYLQIIGGTLTDELLYPLKNVKVVMSLINPPKTKTQSALTVTSNASGNYKFFNVDIGSYKITYTLTGYETFVKTPINLSENSSQNLSDINIKLKKNRFNTIISKR